MWVAFQMKLLFEVGAEVGDEEVGVEVGVVQNLQLKRWRDQHQQAYPLLQTVQHQVTSVCGDESCWDQHGSVVDLSGHDRVVGVVQCGRQSGRGGEVCGAARFLQVGVDCG